MMMMGKFNSADGVNFLRSIDDVVKDYASFLYNKKVITEDELTYFLGDGKNELLDILLGKVYETELVNDVPVNTLDAFYHYCRFIIKKYQGKTIWNKFVKGMFLAIEHHKNTCVMASRSIGKSFFLYSLYPSYKMFLYPNTKFLDVSNIPMQCIENLRIMKDIIDKNEILYQKKDVAKGKELKWTERQIEYNGGMLITLSAGTSPKGLHVHYAVVDDMVTEGCQLNDEEAINYVLGQLYPTVQRNKGRMILSGTPIHKKDLYHFFMGDKPDFEGDIVSDGISWKGFFCKVFPLVDEIAETSLYPEIYTDEEIFGPTGIRETQGDIKFSREYLLHPIDESMTIFSEHLLASCSDGREKYYYTPQTSNEQFLIAADVATSGEASADYSAFIVLHTMEVDGSRKKVIRHIVHEKGMPVPEQINLLENLSRTFNNAPVVVEKNNVGVALIQELGRRNVNVEEFVTSRATKEGMVRYLVNEMKNKNLWFPEKTNEVIRLKKELMNFGVKTNRAGLERMEALAGHDDLVIALAIANEAAQNIGGCPFVALNFD